MPLIACLVGFLGMAEYQWPTLSEELAKHNLPVGAEIGDAARRITSYAVLDDEAWFAIAYYWDNGSGTLPDTLHLRTYDRRTKHWRYRALQNELGGIVDIQRRSAWWYVKGHHTPSAAPTLVLAEDLRPMRTLQGWPELILPDGRIVYHHSMRHFAPEHRGSLGFYDPVTDLDQRLFPAQADSLKSMDDLLDRGFEGIRLAKPNTIVFVAVEQRMKLTRSNTGEAVGPARRLSVTCAVAAKPSCVAREESGRR
jgi:hypothetical protein